ncbi:MAG TPA: ATP/GTP-binding protein [Mycobacteriales bacterium]|nr:ATP/GTP-binding protein [Mycobacteriales bacterium]
MLDRVEEGPDGLDWVVRPVTGAAATKRYRCPGCTHEIPSGTPHMVAWPDGSIDRRRHWHTPCWRARRRRPRG